MPWSGAGERELRNGLLRFLQCSATRARAAQSATARELYWLINETAAKFATAPAGAEMLKDVRDGLIRLAMVADMYERLGDSHCG
jgi:hypothetical protein